MPNSFEVNRTYERLTPARLRVLALVGRSFTLREIALQAGYSYHGVRSCVEALKGIIGCNDIWELGRWWQQYEEGWLDFMSKLGKPSLQPGSVRTRSGYER